MKRFRKTKMALALAPIAFLYSGGIYAQQAAPSDTQGTSQAASSRQAKDDSSSALSEVVVTATKRTSSLQRTPLAVTAIDSKTLEKEHVQTIEDVVHLVPSFQATTEGDHGVITMTLRGIGNDSAKTEYADPEVALFVNGVYTPRAEGASALLFDMASIEVLRGPQGTLWGRNSTVGAVNMQTEPATLGETFGNVEFGLGSYNRHGARGALNVPLSDTLAMRLAFVHEQHDGYVDYQSPPNLSLASQQAAVAAYNLANPTNQVAFQPLNRNLFVQGGPKYNAQDQTAARISFLLKPSNDLSWNVSYETFQDRGTPSLNLMQDPRPGTDLWSALVSVAPYVHRDTYSLRSRVDYAINDGMSLAYIAGYSHFQGASDFDAAGGAVLPTSFTTGSTFQDNRTNYSRYVNYSHELELQSVGKRDLDWILGLYYASEENSIRFDIPIFNGTQQGTVGWQGSFIQPKETVESKAIFGQTTWNVSDALHLTGGLRYTADNRSNVGGTNNGWVGGAGVAQVPIDPSNNPLLPGSGFSTYQHNDGTYSGNKLTWLARIGYDVSPDFLTYASVSTGYKSGGLQDAGYKYGPETLTNYEIGTKQKLLGGALRFNNALYYENFRDYQFSSPITNPDGTHSLFTANASGAKVWGFESELAYKVTPNDRLQLSAAYTHTELGQLIAGSNDYSLPACPVSGISKCLDVTGNQLPHSPRLSLQLQYEHTMHLANGDILAPRISMHYETASWLSVFNLGSGDQQDAYTRTDLGLRYSGRKGWYVDAFVRNLENKNIKTNAANGFGIWQSQYLPPRTFGVNAGTTF